MPEVLFSSRLDSKLETSGGGFEVIVVCFTDGFVMESLKIRLWNGEVVYDWYVGLEMNFGMMVSIGKDVDIRGGGGEVCERLIIKINNWVIA